YLDESIISYQEWDTAIRLAEHYPFAFVAEPGFICYFGNKDSISVAAARTARGYEQIVRKHRNEILLRLGPKTLGTHFESAAYLYRQAGLKEDEKRCLSQAALWWPFRPQPLLRRLGFVKS